MTDSVYWRVRTQGVINSWALNEKRGEAALPPETKFRLRLYRRIVRNCRKGGIYFRGKTIPLRYKHRQALWGYEYEKRGVEY